MEEELEECAFEVKEDDVAVLKDFLASPTGMSIGKPNKRTGLSMMSYASASSFADESKGIERKGNAAVAARKQMQVFLCNQ